MKLLTYLAYALLAMFLLDYLLEEPQDAVLCDGGNEASTPLVDAIKRDAFVSDVEQRLERSEWLESVHLPEVIAEWIRKQGLR